MNRYLPFSGDKPTLEDLEFIIDVPLQAILERTSELFTDGVVTGFGLSKVGLNLLVAPGVAYRGGERIASTETTTVSYPVADSWVFARYTLTEVMPKTHYVTGVTHNTRRIHGGGLRLSTSSATPLDDEVLLGRALADGTLEDLRTFAQVVSDPRMHAPNTDTHTTAADFLVGYESEASPGSQVLTIANALSKHPELQLLFRHAIVNLQDGHGDQMLELRKIPSTPNTPTILAENATLKIHGLPPERDAELRAALDAHEAAAVSVNALTTHLTEVEGYRSLVNAKRLLGYTLDQVRGTANVGVAPDLDVFQAKQAAIVSGAAGVSREPGSLALLSGFTHVVGSGTGLSAGLVGKTLLFQADGLLKEYTVASVNTGAQTLELTVVAGETVDAAWFYLADAESLGYGAAVTTTAEMLTAIDGHKADQTAARAELVAVKATAGDTVLKAFTTQDAAADESYSLQLTWDRPALVDLEEITSYRVRVYELKHNRTKLPTAITKGTLDSTYADLIHKVVEIGSARRQKKEVLQASDLTTTGSTVSLVKVAGPSVFQPGMRVVVGTDSGVVKGYDPASRTVELLAPLPAAPASGVTVTSFQLAWDDEVFCERAEFPIRGAQHLVIYVQAITEHDVGGAWSTGLVVLTDALEDADGVTLAERIRRLRNLEQGRFGVERDRLVAEVQEQLVAVQQALASMPTQDQMDAVVDTLETIQASL
ncbi:MAG: hypothetical protein WC326_08065 [Candidatus Delongbacteria bacterium]